MKKNYLHPILLTGFLFLLFSLGMHAQVCDAPLDFRDWSLQGNLSNANWQVSSDGTTVTQTVNSTPAFFVSTMEYFNTTVEGRFRVNTSSDDDFVGFVLGYHETGNPDKPGELEMILFDWKQATQGNARRGMRLARLKGTMSEIVGALNQFDNTLENENVTNLATNFTTGWADYTWYTFRIAYGESNMKIWLNGNLVMDADGSFSSGHFGFYNFSQEQTVYGSFIVPFSAVIEKSDVQCAGAGNGTARAIPATSAPGPYTYLWSTGETTQSIENLAPGIYSVEITASNGCRTTEEVTIETVSDGEVPQVNTRNIEVDLDENGAVIITPEMIDNGSADNCGIASMSLDITAFDCSMVGENTVNLTVTDTSGNTTSKSAVVDVRDVSAPAVLTQDIDVELDANGQVSITPEMIDGGSADNCGIASMSLDVTAFDCSHVGEQTVTLTVTDDQGNEASETALVSVKDPEAPVVLTQDITVALDAAGQVSITPEMIDNGSADNCSIASMVLDVTDFDCSHIGEQTVVLKVADASGNEASGNATVTIEDVSAPVVITKNIPLELDENGRATLTPEMIDNGSTDNCGIASMSLDITAFDCSMVGYNRVKLTVTDAKGNTEVASALVDVRDSGSPEVITRDIFADLDENGQAVITPEMIDDGSFDECGIASMSLDVTTFDCSRVGAQNVSLTVTDVHGNKASAMAQVTVRDLEAPVALTRNITVALDASGQVSITPEMIDNGSADNCGVASMSLDVADFSCEDTGIQVVILSVYDASGNMSMELAEVLVQNTYEDLDEDGIPDNCDPEVVLDADGDGVRDDVDNCVSVYNPQQEDRNNNGVGDVCEEVVFVSEALSPNGDGVNDTWMIYGIEKYPNNRVEVYSRWGVKVYSGKGYSNTWDGTGINTNKAIPGGAYFYTLDLNGDASQILEGWIYLAK